MTFFVTFLLAVLASIGSSAGTDSETISSLLQDYDKLQLPSTDGVVVNVSVYIQQAALVFDEQYSYMQLQMYLRQKWQDSRLKIADLWAPKLKLPYSFSDRLWKPDLYIDNGASFEMMSAVEDNGLFYVYHNGHVLMSIGAKIKTYCSINLSKFPFDVQACMVSIKSCAHSDDQILFKWDERSPAVLSDDLQIHEFSILNMSTNSQERYFSTGVFSELHLSLVFGRSVSHYVILYFFPATVLVIASWVGLRIPKEKVTARAVIGLSTVQGILVLCYLGRSAAGSRSYLTKTDNYLLLCFFYIFSAMLLSLCQCFCCAKCCQKDENLDDDSFDGESEKVRKRRSCCDMVVLVLIPVSFVAMFFFYFLTLLSADH